MARTKQVGEGDRMRRTPIESDPRLCAGVGESEGESRRWGLGTGGLFGTFALLRPNRRQCRGWEVVSHVGPCDVVESACHSRMSCDVVFFR